MISSDTIAQLKLKLLLQYMYYIAINYMGQIYIQGGKSNRILKHIAHHLYIRSISN